MKHKLPLTLMLIFFIVASVGIAFAAEGGGGGLFAAAGSFAAGGGLLGLGGSIIGGIAKYFHQEQALKKAAAANAHEVILQEMQMKLQREEGERELAIAMEAGRRESMNATIAADSNADSHAAEWVANIKALFRPALTLLLVVLSAVIIFIMVKGDLNNVLDDVTAAAIIRYSIESIIFSASTAVVWWFGDRSMAPPSRK